MTITICMGSACHVKGSRYVLDSLKRLIETHNVGDKVTLAGAFCTDNCQQGVCVKVDGKLFSVSPETTEEFFKREVLAKQ